eukprot:scaffold1399_cov48-Cyclotella_meneghiniana.AAC.4
MGQHQPKQVLTKPLNTSSNQIREPPSTPLSYHYCINTHGQYQREQMFAHGITLPVGATGSIVFLAQVLNPSCLRQSFGNRRSTT